MIKGLIKELFEEVKNPKMQRKVEEHILTPILRYIFNAIAPYFISICVLLTIIVILLLVNIYKIS